MKDKMMLHGNIMRFTKDMVLYETHDRYKLFVDLREIDSNEKANEAYNEILGFMQEIADNGSEGTFLTGRFHDFVVDNIRFKTGYNPLID